MKHRFIEQFGEMWRGTKAISSAYPVRKKVGKEFTFSTTVPCPSTSAKGTCITGYVRLRGARDVGGCGIISAGMESQIPL